MESRVRQFLYIQIDFIFDFLKPGEKRGLCV